MKPRLESARWTEEDKIIFGTRVPDISWSPYVDADRRDADLMLGLVLDKKAYGRFVWPESLWEQYIADGGDGLSQWV